MFSDATGAKSSSAAILLTPSADLGGVARRSYHVGLVLLFLGVLALALIGIGVPLPWMDESATMLALRRSWQGIFELLGGADAPLVPYYLVAKAWISVLGWLPPLVAVRGLSAVAAAGTVAVLYALTARRAGLAPAVLAAGFLVAMPGFMRYAQEARPYALLGLFTAASWLAWDAWHQGLVRNVASRRPPIPVAYLGTLIGGPLMQLFAFLQWPAQLVADLTSPGLDRRDRLRRAFGSGLVMAVAAVLVAIPAWLAATNGTGTRLVASRRLILERLVRTVSGRPELWSVGIVVVMAALAVFIWAFQRGRLARYPDLTRVATIWLAVPLVLALGLVLVRGNLSQIRYFQPMLAPLALLAALGCVALADLVGRMLIAGKRLSYSAIVSLAGLALVAPLVAQASLWMPMQLQIRAISGHDAGFSSVLVMVNTKLAAQPGQSVLATQDTRAAQVLAQHPEMIDNNPFYVVPQSGAEIWPQLRTSAEIEKSLAGEQRAIWMTDKARSSPTQPKIPAEFAKAGFTSVTAARIGDWWVVELRR